MFGLLKIKNTKQNLWYILRKRGFGLNFTAESFKVHFEFIKLFFKIIVLIIVGIIALMILFNLLLLTLSVGVVFFISIGPIGIYIFIVNFICVYFTYKILKGLVLTIYKLFEKLKI